MTWAKLDDAILENRKIVAVGPIGFALHVAAITYCARNLTDGFVPYARARQLLMPEWTEDAVDRSDIPPPPRLPGFELPTGPRIWELGMTSGMTGVSGSAAVEHVIQQVLAQNLWVEVPHGYRLHDYLDYNPSRAQVLAERRAKSEAGRAGAQARGLARAQAGAEAGASTERLAERQPVPVPVPVPVKRPVPRNSPSGELSLADAGSSDVARVFAAWKTATGKNGRTSLSDKRRRVIAAALKSYPLDEVIDAVQGWQRISFYAGENDRHTVYNDIELLLRDARHIEQFRDAQRGELPTGRMPLSRLERSVQDDLAMARQLRAEGR